jgi:hypothetical protein
MFSPYQVCFEEYLKSGDMDELASFAFWFYDDDE